MKNIKPIYLVQGIMLTLIGICSCNKLIDVGQPTDALPSEKVFSDQATALSALNGLYIQFMNTGQLLSNSLVTITAGLSSDELKQGTSTASYDEFQYNILSSGNSYVANLWSNAYTRIYQCNALIERAMASSQLPAVVKDRIIGEASFCRAFLYFYLIQMYGDVPLVTSTDYRLTATLPRSNTKMIYDLIQKDLDMASKLLPERLSGSRTSPDRWCAQALKARTFLYQQDWASAQMVSNEVITSGAFILENDVDNVFLTGSKEAIWQLAPIDGRASTWEGSYFIPVSNIAPRYPLTGELISSFETGDVRKAKWIGSKTIGTQTYGYPFKYKVSGGTGAPIEYYTPMRLAEQYLIRAEASLNLGDVTSALKDIDLLRHRAGLSPYGTDGRIYNQGAVQLFIENERRHELFCEWGDRWFDLKRTGRALPVLEKLKPELKATALLFPIPFNQIQYNAALAQNPGY